MFGFGRFVLKTVYIRILFFNTDKILFSTKKQNKNLQILDPVLKNCDIESLFGKFSKIGESEKTTHRFCIVSCEFKQLFSFSLVFRLSKKKNGNNHVFYAFLVDFYKILTSPIASSCYSTQKYVYTYMLL